MHQTRVGVRDLKARLSQYLRLVKAGQTVVITERGREVGRIIPPARTLEEKIQAMVQAGLASWNGQKLGPFEPVARVRGERTVADLLTEDRE